MTETPSRSSRIDLWGGAVLLAAAGYMLLWWNRSMSPTLGFEMIFANEYARDRLPYRDYYFPVQPGWALVSIASVQWFGYHLLPFWIAGFVARLLAVWLVYRLLVRICPIPWAALVTFTSFIASCGDLADYTAWYNYFVSVFAIFSAYAAVRLVEATTVGQRFVACIGTGLALAACFFNKQTAGLMMPVVIGIGMMIALGQNYAWRRTCIDLGIIAITFAIPCLILFAWMVQNDVWSAYVEQVYLNGPSSKGGLLGALGRAVWFRVYDDSTMPLSLFAIAFLVISAALVLRPVSPTPQQESRFRRIVVGTLAVVSVILLISVIQRHLYFNLRSLRLFWCEVGVLGSGLVLLWAIVQAIRGRADYPTQVIGLFAGAAFTVAFCQTLSWPLFEPLGWPATPVILGFLGRVIPPSDLRQRLVRWSVAFCAFVIALSAWDKFHHPFQWGGWPEPPIWECTHKPSHPVLAGFRLGAHTAQVYDELGRLIQQYSQPGEEILAFPFVLIAHAVGERPIAGFAYMHYIDVCPDAIARADAQRILRHLPAIIVHFEFPEGVWDMLEQAFRGGARSGQRDMLAAIDELTRTQYTLVGEFALPNQPPNSHPPKPLRVWARKRTANSE